MTRSDTQNLEKFRLLSHEEDFRLFKGTIVYIHLATPLVLYSFIILAPMKTVRLRTVFDLSVLNTCTYLLIPHFLMLGTEILV